MVHFTRCFSVNEFMFWTLKAMSILLGRAHSEKNQIYILRIWKLVNFVTLIYLVVILFLLSFYFRSFAKRWKVELMLIVQKRIETLSKMNSLSRELKILTRYLEQARVTEYGENCTK